MKTSTSDTYEQTKKQMVDKLTRRVKKEKGTLTLDDITRINEIVDDIIYKIKEENSLLTKLSRVLNIVDMTKLLIEKIDDLFIATIDMKTVNRINKKCKENKDVRICTNMVLNQLKEYGIRTGKIK